MWFFLIDYLMLSHVYLPTQSIHIIKIYPPSLAHDCSLPSFVIGHFRKKSEIVAEFTDLTYLTLNMIRSARMRFLRIADCSELDLWVHVLKLNKLKYFLLWYVNTERFFLISFDKLNQRFKCVFISHYWSCLYILLIFTKMPWFWCILIWNVIDFLEIYFAMKVDKQVKVLDTTIHGDIILQERIDLTFWF